MSSLLEIDGQCLKKLLMNLWENWVKHFSKNIFLWIFCSFMIYDQLFWKNYLLVKKIKATPILLYNQFWLFFHMGKCSGVHWKIVILEDSTKWKSFDIFNKLNIFFRKSENPKNGYISSNRPKKRRSEGTLFCQKLKVGENNVLLFYQFLA